MRWLVTANAGADLSEVVERLRNIGCTDVDLEAAVPMGPDEVVVPVDGPNDLDARVAGEPMLTGAFNDSDVTLYD